MKIQSLDISILQKHYAHVICILSRLRKKAEKEGMSPAEYAKKDIPKMFLLEIENRSNDRNSLSGYLTMCVKEKIISRAQANAILEDFGKL